MTVAKQQRYGSGELSEHIENLNTDKDTHVINDKHSVAIPIEQNRELIEQAIALFNLKPAKGIDFLVDNEVILRTSTAVANFLYYTPNLSYQNIGIFIGDGQEFNVQVLAAFVDLMEFAGLEFDVALRQMLLKFRLPKEAQQIDRIMEKFADKYYKQNCDGGVFASSDSVYIMAFSTIMLNTDAHNPNVKRKMTKTQFLGQHASFPIPTPFIENLYDRIVNDGIKLAGEEQTAKKRKWRRGRFKAWRNKLLGVKVK